MKETTVEILIIVVVLLLAFGAFNPFWMPMGVYMALLLALVALFGTFTLFLWREQGGDERDVLLRSLSDRVAFLAGSLVLLISIVYEAFVHHSANEWITGAFIAMILAKAGSAVYYRSRN